MNFREYIEMWIGGYRNRGSEFMAKLLEEMLANDKDTLYDMHFLISKWEEEKDSVVKYSPEFQKAWLVVDSLKEVIRWKDFDKVQLREWMYN